MASWTIQHPSTSYRDLLREYVEAGQATNDNIGRSWTSTINIDSNKFEGLLSFGKKPKEPRLIDAPERYRKMIEKRPMKARIIVKMVNGKLVKVEK
jgi:hypothetical protein